MNDEQVVVITTQTKNKVSIKSWVSARDRRDITKALFENVEISADSSPKVSGSAINESQDATIKKLVVKIEKEDKSIIENDAEKILEILLDLPSSDFDEVIEKINEVTSADDKKVKK